MGVKGAVAAGVFRNKVNNMVPSRVSQNQSFKGGLKDFSSQFGRNFESQPKGTPMNQAKMNALVGTATSNNGMSALGQMGKGALQEGRSYLNERMQANGNPNPTQSVAANQNALVRNP